MFVSGPIDLLLPMPLYLLAVALGMGLRPAPQRVGRAPPARPPRRAAWITLALWAWLLSMPVTSNTLVRWIEGSPRARPVEVARDERSLIVVLASGDLEPTRLDQAGWERLQGAVHLQRQTGGRLLFVGGPGLATADSLGLQMRAVAVELGLDARLTQGVGGGRNTYEDLRSASAIVAAHRGPVWLVTSALHMPRARATAERAGWTVKPYPVGYEQLDLPLLPSLLPSNGGPERLALGLHELIGRLVYRLRGWST
jgi:uncharacterized SAM-binding protein YcdF (DUF218 family)